MADDQPLSGIGEHAFLDVLCRRLRAGPGGKSPRIVIGPGDDAAVVQPSGRPLVLTTDALVEEVHFRAAWCDSAALGARTALVNLSDLAAMAARPTEALLAVTAPAEIPAHQLESLIDGCAAALARHGATLVGGNLSAGPVLTLTLSLIGELDGPPLLRDTARPGDRLLVSGTLGDAAGALSFLLHDRPPPPVLLERWRTPTPRLELAQMLARAGVRAGLDLSDGLACDARHLCRASGVGARIHVAALPVSAALRDAVASDAERLRFATAGGEDYELLVAVAPELVGTAREIGHAAGCPVHEIGEIVAGEDVVLIGADGTALAASVGFDHFQARVGQ